MKADTSLKQVTKEEFYNSFKTLQGVTTGVDLNDEWVVRHHGKRVAMSKDRPGIGDDEDYCVTEYFLYQ
jgi:hypothetical protein